MIEGLNIRCNVGPFEVLRSPRLRLCFQRSKVLSRAEIDLPDPDGDIRAGCAAGMPVQVRFGYRGEAGLWHEWTGTIAGVSALAPDSIRVRVEGREKALLSTTIRESFAGEPADLVARRILAATGLPVARIDAPGDILPHMIFAGIPAARAIRQLAESLTRSFGHDLRRHAVWLGADGVSWSDGDEPGDIPVVATAENLIRHAPTDTPGALSEIVAVLLPGLIAGRQVIIRDARLGLTAQVRALEVEHLIEAGSGTTRILYGEEYGWC